MYLTTEIFLYIYTKTFISIRKEFLWIERDTFLTSPDNQFSNQPSPAELTLETTPNEKIRACHPCANQVGRMSKSFLESCNTPIQLCVRQMNLAEAEPVLKLKEASGSRLNDEEEIQN